MKILNSCSLALCLLFASPWMGHGLAENKVAMPVGPDQALEALQPVGEPLDLDAPVDHAKLKLLMSQSRGPALEVFPKVAPSTVVVRTSGGHGTGFIVDANGWVLTNNHVIQAASIDVTTGARFAMVHFGKFEDGIMSLEQEGIAAYVHASSPEKDLALLKLVKLPEGRQLQPIKFAEKNAVPGTDCITIGHPSRGLFWSVRSGEIVGVGKYPHDLIESVMPLFSLASTDKELFAESLRQSSMRKVFLSTCGINPGDSGGPLVNTQGELIAVNFAIPKMDTAQGVNLDKFSYHVHLDEVKAFTAKMPDKPEIFEPSFWPPATHSHLLDKDGDDKFETWLFAVADDQPPSGIFFDLDSDTPGAFLEDFKAGKANRDHFDAEIIYTRLPSVRVYYDRDNDGKIDMILTDVNGDGMSDLTIARNGDAWEKLESESQPILDAELFKDEQLKERFNVLVLGKQAEDPFLEEDRLTPDSAPAAPPAS